MTTQTERSIKEITTPNGHKVIIYDYITGGEARKIQALYMESIKAGDVVGAGKSTDDIIKNVPVTTVLKAQELALSFLIVSVDGSTKEEAFKRAMDLREADLEVLIGEIDKYTAGTIAKKKE